MCSPWNFQGSSPCKWKIPFQGSSPQKFEGLESWNFTEIFGDPVPEFVRVLVLVIFRELVPEIFGDQVPGSFRVLVPSSHPKFEGLRPWYPYRDLNLSPEIFRDEVPKHRYWDILNLGDLVPEILRDLVPGKSLSGIQSPKFEGPWPWNQSLEGIFSEDYHRKG